MVRRNPHGRPCRCLGRVDPRPRRGPERLARGRRRRALRPRLLRDTTDDRHQWRRSRGRRARRRRVRDAWGSLGLRVGLHARRLRRWHGLHHGAGWTPRNRVRSNPPRRRHPTDVGHARAARPASNDVDFGDRAEIPAWRTYTWPGLTVTRPGALANATTVAALISFSAAAVLLGTAGGRSRSPWTRPSTSGVRSRRRPWPSRRRSSASSPACTAVSTWRPLACATSSTTCGAVPSPGKPQTPSGGPASGWPPPRLSPPVRRRADGDPARRRRRDPPIAPAGAPHPRQPDAVSPHGGERPLERAPRHRPVGHIRGAARPHLARRRNRHESLPPQRPTKEPR